MKRWLLTISSAIPLVCCFMGLLAAQETLVSGRVLWEDGKPIENAAVLVKGTQIGTSTDQNGEFSLPIPPNASVLLFSFVGAVTKEVPITSSTVYHIALEKEILYLDEVVAIGYGAVKKSDVTGAVTSVKGEVLSSFPTTNITHALQGRAAGVHIQQNTGAPGAPLQVRIRGANSISGSNEPLWVIDGFPGNQNMLSYSDIESIEILKDASATAIYGSRGANGVILVTTKEGKAGVTRVDYDGSFSLQRLRKKADLMNQQEYARYVNIQQFNDNGIEFFSPSDIAGFGKGTDWQDLIFQEAPIHSHSLTVSGGSEKTKFSVGANYFDQSGIVRESYFKRIGIRAALDHDISKKVGVSFNAILTRSDNSPKNSVGGSRGGSLFGAAIGAPPTISPFNDDGSYRLLSSIYPFIPSALMNPIAYTNEAAFNSSDNAVMASLAFNIKPIEGLSIRLSGNVSNNDSRSDTYISLKYPNSVGSASIGFGQNLQLNSYNIVNYERLIGNDHSVSVTGGFTYESSVSKGAGLSGEGFLSDIYETHNIGSAATINTPASSYSDWRLLSYLGRLNYSFKGKYLVTASYRADGSSRYSVGNKWGYFPSAAVAWRVSDENFLQESDFISNLKVRLGYGETGSTAVSPYYTLDMLSSGKTVFGTDLHTYFMPSTRLPGALRWETTAQTNIGLDLGILANRLRLTADYYIKNTRDLLNTVQLPSSLGYTTTVQNIGKVRNKGLEIQLDADIFDSQFKWNVSSNISFNRNQVIKLHDGQDIRGATINVHIVEDYPNLVREGQPLGIFYGYQELGYNENGQITYHENDGVDGISSADKTFIGNPHPDFIYGFNSNMSWKNFEFSFFIQGSQGNDIFSFSMIQQTLDYGFGLNTLKDILYDHWTPENPDAKYPKISRETSTLMSDRFVYDGSYLRLKNILLAYNLPVGKHDVLGLKGAQIYVSGQNLLTVTKYPWWDPEINSYGGSNSISQGIDHYSFPTAKGFTTGIKLFF